MYLADISQLKSKHYKPVMGLFSFADKHDELWLRLTAKWLFQTTVLFCYGSCDIKFLNVHRSRFNFPDNENSREEHLKAIFIC